MTDDINMVQFTAPKSDQLNADDLIGGPRTVTVTGVRANEGSPEQPVSISFEGDQGKPYKPCKSMRRVMVHVWGADAKGYVGRSMTLYCDPEVQFGGMKVGGIRISHMSHTDKPVTMALTATKAKRKPYTVEPLIVQAAPDAAGLLARYETAATQAQWEALETERAAMWKQLAAPDKAALKAASERRKGILDTAAKDDEL